MAVNSSASAVTQFLRHRDQRTNATWLNTTRFVSHGARALMPGTPSRHTYTAAVGGGLVNNQVGAPGFPFDVDHYFELHYLAVVFHYTVVAMHNPRFDETDLAFVAEIANMPENLFNLAKAFHGIKTIYFGEGSYATLRPGDALHSYLTAAAPVFQAAIDARRQLLVANHVYAGFKIDFLDAIKDTPFYHGDWDNYDSNKDNATAELINPWCV